MATVTAQLNDYRQSPRKVRIVADTIRGKKAIEAKNILGVVIKRASNPLAKLLDSAMANAKNMGIGTENLVVDSIEINGGKILYRRMPVAHGSSNPIRKRTSHVKIVLSERAPKVQKSKAKTKNSKLKTLS